MSSSASRLTGTRQPFIWFSFWSAMVRSISLISGTHTMKCAVPVYVSYLTITVALDDPRISDPSTYTELHDDVTCTETSRMYKYHTYYYVLKGTGQLEPTFTPIIIIYYLYLLINFI